MVRFQLANKTKRSANSREEKVRIVSSKRRLNYIATQRELRRGINIANFLANSSRYLQWDCCIDFRYFELEKKARNYSWSRNRDSSLTSKSMKIKWKPPTDRLAPLSNFCFAFYRGRRLKKSGVEKKVLFRKPRTGNSFLSFQYRVRGDSATGKKSDVILKSLFRMYSAKSYYKVFKRTSWTDFLSWSNASNFNDGRTKRKLLIRCRFRFVGRRCRSSKGGRPTDRPAMNVITFGFDLLVGMARQLIPSLARPPNSRNAHRKSFLAFYTRSAGSTRGKRQTQTQPSGRSDQEEFPDEIPDEKARRVEEFFRSLLPANFKCGPTSKFANSSFWRRHFPRFFAIDLHYKRLCKITTLFPHSSSSKKGIGMLRTFFLFFIFLMVTNRNFPVGTKAIESKLYAASNRAINDP